MREVLGLSRTVELTLTGRFMASEEALSLGVLHYVVAREEVLPFAESVALDLASKPKDAMQIIKRRFFEVLEPGLDDAIKAAKRLHKESFETGEPQREINNFLKDRSQRKDEKH
jgi:enoyl-CoA hydratase/carnithine racemase